jgi:hypothetical protein
MFVNAYYRTAFDLWLKLISKQNKTKQNKTFFLSISVQAMSVWNCGLWWTYCPSPAWQLEEYVALVGMIIDRGKPKRSEKNLSQYHCVYNKSHLDILGIKPCPKEFHYTIRSLQT